MHLHSVLNLFQLCFELIPEVLFLYRFWNYQKVRDLKPFGFYGLYPHSSDHYWT